MLLILDCQSTSALMPVPALRPINIRCRFAVFLYILIYSRIVTSVIHRSYVVSAGIKYVRLNDATFEESPSGWNFLFRA